MSDPGTACSNVNTLVDPPVHHCPPGRCPHELKCQHRYRITQAYRDERLQETFIDASCESCGEWVYGSFVMPMDASFGVACLVS